MSHRPFLIAATCLGLTLAATALQAAQPAGGSIGQVIRPTTAATARPADVAPPKTKPVPSTARATITKTTPAAPHR